MNKYNDGLNNETEVQIISTHRRPISEKTKKIISDLGTVPNSVTNLNTLQPNLESTLGTAEMYNNTNIVDLDGYYYTFQQSNENDCADKPRSSPKENLSERDVVGQDVFGSLVVNGSGTKKINEPKRLNPNDHYTNISVAINSIRNGDRYQRMTFYASLQEVNDKKYSIFLVGNLTTAHDEVKRSILKKNNNDYLLKIYDSMINTYSKCLIGRLRYNPGKKKSNIFYKKNIKSALVAIFVENNQFKCHLHVVGYDFIFDLSDRFMSEKQKQVYDMMGFYNEDFEDHD